MDKIQAGLKLLQTTAVKAANAVAAQPGLSGSSGQAAPAQPADAQAAPADAQPAIVAPHAERPVVAEERPDDADDEEEGDGEEEGDEDEDEDEEEDDDDEEEEEPSLKYLRIGASIQEVLGSHTASCMVVHDKFFALGTHEGTVFMFDFSGNEMKRFTEHTTTVNDLSVDGSGEFLASCSDEGKIVVHPLFTSDELPVEYTPSEPRPVKAVAMGPDFGGKNSKQQFIFGGKSGHLISVAKKSFAIGNLFGGRAEQVLHQGEGAIHAIRWRGQLLAWGNDVSINVYDFSCNQRIGVVRRPKAPRADLYRCCLYWESDKSLIVGWGQMIRVVQITDRENPPAGMPKRALVIVLSVDLEYYLCGIAPFGDNLAVLAYVEDDSQPQRAERERPELRIINRAGEELSTDGLPIKGFENYRALNYRLEYLPGEEQLFYIVSPKDIVIAKERDINDRVQWLTQRQRYEKAISVVEAAGAANYAQMLTDIGEKYLEHLFTQGDFATAAKVCAKTLKQNVQLWDKWVMRFSGVKRLREIVPYVPLVDPQLSNTSYEAILYHLLKDDHEQLLETIKKWSPKLYNIATIVNVLQEHLKTTSDPNLLLALGLLYEYSNQHHKTLELYLRMKRGPVFELIQQHNLFSSIVEGKLIRSLMEFNEVEATKLFLSNTDKIDINVVATQLKDARRLQHVFLDALFEKDQQLGADLHALQVELYADFAREKLLKFLRISNRYSLEQALQVCESRQLYAETAFILCRMGNNKEALNLIMTKQRDIGEAIKFAQEQNDPELWEDLITYSLKDPLFIAGLLQNIGSQVDPIMLIQRIPNGMEIPNLRDHLVKIISDYSLEMSLRVGCNVILKDDCVVLFESFVNGQRKGTKIFENIRCQTCSAYMLHGKATDDMVIFSCAHVYHYKCLRSAEQHQEGLAGAPIQSPPPGARAGAAGTSFPAGSSAPEERLWCTICKSKQRQAAVSKTGARRPAGPSGQNK